MRERGGEQARRVGRRGAAAAAAAAAAAVQLTVGVVEQVELLGEVRVDLPH